MAASLNARHSAIVVMELQIHGQIIPVAQVSRDYLIVRESVTLPACEGTLRIAVDGHETLRPIALPEGLNPDRVKTPARALGPVQPQTAAAAA